MSRKLSGKNLKEIISHSGAYDTDLELIVVLKQESAPLSYKQNEIHHSFFNSTNNKAVNKYFMESKYSPSVKCLRQIPYAPKTRHSKRKKLNNGKYYIQNNSKSYSSKLNRKR